MILIDEEEDEDEDDDDAEEPDVGLENKYYGAKGSASLAEERA